MLRALLLPLTAPRAARPLGLARPRRMAWAVAGLAALLVACGGGGGGGSQQVGPTSNDGVPRIEPYERTASLSAVQLRSVMPEPTGPAVVPARVVLDPLGAPQPDMTPRAPGQPVPIGQAREITATADAAATATWLAWQPLASGGQAAAITFRSQGAAGLRLALRVDRWPAQAVLRVFGSEGDTARLTAAEVQEGLARSAFAPGTGSSAGLFWLPPTAGEETTLQIELPAGADAAGISLAVPQLSHQWWTPVSARAATEAVTPRVGTCQLDAQCEAGWSQEANAVARVTFQSGGTTFTCTGTLMANANRTGTPYFLTANHCVGNQAEANTVVTYWFYRSTACNSGAGATPVQVSGGATLLHTSGDSDASFMRLNQNPPVGAWYAGSLVGQPAARVGVGTLHHPDGSWLRFSEGTISSYAFCVGTSCGASTDDSGNYLKVNWSRGVTEGGSSGSALFATVGSTHYVVGHLFAGNSSCSEPTRADYYGRFDRAYPSLKQWLWPNGP